MNTISPNAVLIEIRPWQEALYEQMRRPTTVAGVKRKLKNTKRHLLAARAAADADAVQGIVKAAELLLLELVAVDVTTAREVEKKAVLLREWADQWRHSPLLALAIRSGSNDRRPEYATA